MASEKIVIDIDPKIRIKLATYYMDQAKDVDNYEAVLNSPNCSILKEQPFTLTEKEKEFVEGVIVSERTFQRVYIMVKYQEQTV